MNPFHNPGRAETYFGHFIVNRYGCTAADDQVNMKMFIASTTPSLSLSLTHTHTHPLSGVDNLYPFMHEQIPEKIIEFLHKKKSI
jgi:hypothetical protein